MTSVESTVAQPAEAEPMFALNRSGKLARRLNQPRESRRDCLPREERERLEPEEPPVTVTGAQFMYISRLPILLNQVHASVYSPGEMPEGME